jgi:type VI protein secretion system component VasK
MTNETIKNKKILENRFHGAIDFIKNQQASLDKKIFDLPWIFILSTEEANTTKLLQYTGLEFILKKKHETPIPSYCHWWATKDLLLLDINPLYCDTTLSKDNEKSWEHFLKLIHKQKAKPIEALWLILDLNSLLTSDKNEQQAFYSLLRKRIISLESKFHQAFPIYFTITHIDLLKGFVDFFDDFSSRERHQPWGIYFHPKDTKSPQAFIENFEMQFNALLKNLNDRVITRLHRERNLEKRIQIKDFPLQMESLKKPLSHFLNELTSLLQDKTIQNFRGIFFTAVEPTHSTQDRLLQPLSKTFALEPYHSSARSSHYSHYFTEALINEVFLPDSRAFYTPKMPVIKTKTRTLKYLGVFSTCLIILGFFGFLFHNYFYTNSIIREADDNLAQYDLMEQLQENFNLNQNLIALNKLNEAYESFLNISQHALIKEKTMNELTEKTKIAYFEALKKFILLQFQTALNNDINQPILDSSALYGDLKAIMMLSDKKHYDPQYIKARLNHYWQLEEPALNSHDLTLLNQHVDNFIVLFQPEPNANYQELIFAGREKLSKISPAMLINIMLENNDNQPTLNISLASKNGEADFFENSQTIIKVPRIYTAKMFEHIYDDILPQIASELKAGDWVTGQRHVINPMDDSTLMKIREQYIKNYIDTWTAILNQLNLAPINSYHQALNAIKTMTTPSSSFANIMKTIYENTNVSYHNIPTPISENFLELDKVIYLFKQNEYKNLLLVQIGLQNIINASNQANAASEFTELQLSENALTNPFANLQKISEQAPLPINNWLSSLLKDTWQLLLNDNASIINNEWEKNIYPFFKANLANHYPFNQESIIDADPVMVDNFFAKNGLFQTFYHDHLSLFLEEKNDELTPKKFYGATLPLSDNAYHQLQHLKQFSALFYQNEHPEHFAFELMLNPEKISDETKSVIIDIDGQTQTYSPDSLSPTRIAWPGKNNEHFASVIFTNQEGLQQSVTKSGPWAIFKIFNASNFVDSQLISPRIIESELTLGPYSFTYSLSSDEPINPFTEGTLVGLSLISSLLMPSEQHKEIMNNASTT